MMLRLSSFDRARWAPGLQRLSGLLMLVGLAACMQAPVAPPSTAAAADQDILALDGAWVAMALPGKRSTRYAREVIEGRPVIRARAQASASMFRRDVLLEPVQLGSLDFSWWVPALIPSANLSDREAADSPVRVVLAFDGDVARLPAKDRMMFELAETLTGRAPPYATLMYVWDNTASLEAVIPGGRSDRIRKIVVDSGPVGLKSWRQHRRDIVRDFERAFGEPPGRLVGVALMTDSDNTGSQAQALYGPLRLIGPDGRVSILEE